MRTRPSPAHSGHGRGMTVPKPWHCGHGREVMTCPRKERWTWLTSPRPRHMSQVTSCGARRRPGAVAGRCTRPRCRPGCPGWCRRPPRRGRSRAGSARPGRAGPGCAARAARAVPPKKASMMSLKREAGARSRRRHRCRSASGSPPRSYISLLLRVGEHLVGVRDLLEPLLRLRVRVDVRVQLAGEPAVGPLDLVRRRVAAHAEDGVVVVVGTSCPIP